MPNDQDLIEVLKRLAAPGDLGSVGVEDMPARLAREAIERVKAVGLDASDARLSAIITGTYKNVQQFENAVTDYMIEGLSAKRAQAEAAQAVQMVPAPEKDLDTMTSHELYDLAWDAVKPAKPEKPEPKPIEEIDDSRTLHQMAWEQTRAARKTARTQEPDDNPIEHIEDRKELYKLALKKALRKDE